MDVKEEKLLKELYEESSNLIYEMATWFEHEGRNVEIPDSLQRAYIKVNDLTDDIAEYYDGTTN